MSLLATDLLRRTIPLPVFHRWKGSKILVNLGKKRAALFEIDKQGALNFQTGLACPAHLSGTDVIVLSPA